MRRSFIVIGVIFGCVVGEFAEAVGVLYTPQVAFTTLDNFGGYEQNAATRISGASAFPDGYEAYACQFVPVLGGTLSSIELGLGYSIWGSPDSQVDVTLALATGGLPDSGPILASGTLTTSTLFGNGGLTSFIPATPVQIDIGTAYWLMVTPHSDSTASDWCNTSSPINGTIGYVNPFSPIPRAWYTGYGAGMKAFQVDVVPEPAGIALAGLLAVIAFLKHGRTRFQDSGVARTSRSMAIRCFLITKKRP